jgi:hypothetical protein
MTIEQLTSFFGWMSVLNIGLFLFSMIFLIILRPWMLNLHQILFKIERAELRKVYLIAMGVYKIIIIMFNLIPYFALKIMG